MFSVLFHMAQATEQLNMIGYSYVDWCGDKIDKRSTTCFVFMLKGASISWSSEKTIYCCTFKL